MNTTGLLPYQHEHMKSMMTSLVRYGSVLDASDTGTGKTYVSLAVCRELGIVPLIIGPRTSRKTWERAAATIGIDIEWINYERVRGRREKRGGVEIDAVRLTTNRDCILETPAYLTCYRNGDTVLKRACSWSDASSFLFELGITTSLFETGDWTLEIPCMVDQVRTSESDWVEEKKYGSGSFIKWKNNYACIIFDEVHRCGGSTTLNSKCLIAAKRQAKFVICLSATAADDPTQMKALGFTLGLHKLNDKTFGYRQWLFRHGCMDDDDGFGSRMRFSMSKITQAKTFDKLNEEIFPKHGARMRKALIPGFPHSQLMVKLLEDESGKAEKLSRELKELYDQYQDLAKMDSEYLRRRQALEILMVPNMVDFVDDLFPKYRVALFVNFTQTLDSLVTELSRKYGQEYVGFIDGSQVGQKGELERNAYCEAFQRNELAAIVVNSQAGGENISLHDPTGKIERATGIAPCDSGKRLKQILGRVDRAGGADSIQYLLYFAGTEQETTANRMESRLNNIELLNDADLW